MPATDKRTRKRQRGSSNGPAADDEHADPEPQHADSDPPSEDEAPQKKPRKQQRQQRQNIGTVRKTYKRRAPKVRGLSVAEAEAHLGSVGKRLIEAVTEAADVQQLKERAAALPVRHLNDKQALLQGHRQQFPLWHWQLREGFSLLLHGYGSKRTLLEAFGREQLTDGGVIVAAGHQQGLTARKLLHLVVQKATGRPTSGRRPAELLAALAAGGTGAPLYVLLHNIDGPGLRSLADQALLSEMAACPGVHLAATIDHCSAPLLWDRQATARFNWVWHDATTFAPYTAETLDVPPVLSGGLQAAGRRAAGAVLRSMVPRSRAVFAVLAEQQAEDPEGEGVALPHLYRLCRERFLVATEAALRGHLVEFKDHDLLRTRVSSEGQEVMYIPLEPEAVQKLLEQLQELD